MNTKECIKFLEDKKRIVNESFGEDLDVIIELLQEGETYKQNFKMRGGKLNGNR